MKTSELLKWLDENEINYKETSRNIQIINNIGLQLIRVHKKENEIIFDEETFFNNSNNSALSIEDLTKILQYVETPIEEREEEKKYKVRCRITNDVLYEDEKLEWRNEYDRFTHFTLEELKDLGIDVEHYDLEEVE